VQKVSPGGVTEGHEAFHSECNACSLLASHSVTACQLSFALPS